MATQELGGKSCSIGIRNCKHPFQWPRRSIRQMRLNIRINIPAILRNCKEETGRLNRELDGRGHSVREVWITGGWRQVIRGRIQWRERQSHVESTIVQTFKKTRCNSQTIMLQILTDIIGVNANSKHIKVLWPFVVQNYSFVSV